MARPGVLRAQRDGAYAGVLSDGRTFTAYADVNGRFHLYAADGTRVRMLSSSLSGVRARFRGMQADLDDPRSLADLLGAYLALDDDVADDPFGVYPA